MFQGELVPRSGFVPLVAAERLTLLHPDVLGHHRNNLDPFMLKRALLTRWISPVNKSVGFNLADLLFCDRPHSCDLFGRFFPRQGLGLSKLGLICA